MNHDLVKLFTEKLDNLTISDYYGLNSPGLTCYLNSVLQVLFMTEDFRGSIKRCCSNGSTTIDTLLGKLFKDLERGLAETHRFIINLGITDVYKQRDAAEYFEKILCLTSLEASKIFKGKLNHKTTCVRCKKTNDSSAFFWILPLAMKNSPRHTYSVETGLKAFFKKDHVYGDDRMFCDQCNEKQDAFIECELAQTPVILTLLLKRFTFDHEQRSYVKLHCEVDVPQTLHIGNCKYDLYALVNHYGNLSGGHYTSQIRSFETGEWYCFNDESVQRVRRPLFGSGNSVRSRTAYLVMYRKGSTHSHSEKSHEVNPDAEGRHDKAERGETLPPHLHQLKDDSCTGGENSKLLNGDAFKSSDEMLWMKLADSSTEAVKQLNTKQPNRKQLNTNSLKKRLQPETDWDGTGRDGTEAQQETESNLQK